MALLFAFPAPNGILSQASFGKTSTLRLESFNSPSRILHRFHRHPEDQMADSLTISTATSNRLGSARAPQEIWELAIEHLADDKKALNACSQVCRRFSPRSQALLFAHWDPRDETEVRTILNVRRLADLVRASPHVAAYIRQFWVFLGPPDDPTAITRYPDGAMPLITQLLPNLPNIHTIHLLSLSPDGAVDWKEDHAVSNGPKAALLAAFQHVATFERVTVKALRNFDLAFVSAASHIRRLELRSVLVTREPLTFLNQESSSFDPNPRRKCVVESLMYYFATGRCPERFVNYCLDHPDSTLELGELKSLSLRDPTDSTGANPISRLLRFCAPALVNLTLGYNSNIAAGAELPNLLPLERLAALRLDLSLAYYSNASHEERCNQAIQIVRSLPVDSQVRSITLIFHAENRYLMMHEAEVRIHDWRTFDDALFSAQTLLPHLDRFDVIYKYRNVGLTPGRFSENFKEEDFPHCRSLEISVSRRFEFL
ncbi:unnamed protein product [Cyclocybe aegerita]|uniref:Uncharacterized protein n=1 Tax=Cyclocybe aegerita TaxID=1973307 RepID=A0A8S0WSL5_CYCAE|nr:unnamed protein product [Cyclocybe aegerita]